MANTKSRILRDIPELVSTLREQSKRLRDFVVPHGKMTFGTDEKKLVLTVQGKDGQREALDIQDQVHRQFGERFQVPMNYYSRMREEAPQLLATNLNHWRAQGEEDKKLVRVIDDQVRAFLSSKYRPISHLDVLTTAVQVITGRDGEAGKELPHARGARCFGWNVSPTNLNVGLVNPFMVVDLKNLSAGVKLIDPTTTKNGDGGGTDFVYAGKHVQSDNPTQGGWFQRASDPKNSHLVFPVAWIRNSETGHGGLSISGGMYEAICDNTSKIGKDFMQVHIGRDMEEGEFSSKTYEKINAVVFAKAADVIRNVFDPVLLLANAKKMARLADEKADVKEAVDEIVKLPGMSEDVRDDILAAYQPMTTGKETLLDVQRAVTAAAHVYRDSKPETAIALEELGGDMIEKGRKALQVA